MQVDNAALVMQVVNHFDELVEEGHVAHDALLKIFTKKIKRSKKKDEGEALHSSIHRCCRSFCTVSMLHHFDTGWLE